MILILNAGSSSVKYKLFSLKKKLMYEWSLEHIGDGTGQFSDHDSAFRWLFEDLSSRGRNSITAIGHRVVHWGPDFVSSTLITPTILRKIDEFTHLAPLHNPLNLLWIKLCQQAFPQAKQIAIFDTAFHQTMKPTEFLYGLPYSYYEKHQVRRYSFHGIANQSVLAQSYKTHKIPRSSKLILCHLGSGASVTAVHKGKSLQNSTGMTPLAGLLMSTRPGDLDPGIFLYLTQHLKKTPEEIHQVLNYESGLLGISGISKDMKTLLELAQQKNIRAQLAIDLYLAQIIKYIGSYIALLGGIDAIIFSGGVGERSAHIRKAIQKKLKRLTPQPQFLVIPADEEGCMFDEVLDLVK